MRLCERSGGGSMRQFTLFFLLAAIVAAVPATTAQSAGSFSVVVQQGQSSGAGNGNFFALDDPVLNDLGRVAFTGFSDTSPFFLAIQGTEPAHIVVRGDLQAPD